jgi:hypothetical protein
MGPEIGEGHVARQHERGRPGEQAERDQDAADELHRPGEIEHRRRLGERQMGEADEFARAEFEEQESSDDAQHGEQRASP